MTLFSFEKNAQPLDEELESSFKIFFLADNSPIRKADDPKKLLENLRVVAYEVRRIYDDGDRHKGKSYLDILNDYRTKLEESPYTHDEENSNDPYSLEIRKEKINAAFLLSLALIGFSKQFHTKKTTFDVTSENTQLNSQRISEALTKLNI